MNDEQRLAQLGYRQELHRALGGFSNYALSMSIICILAGGITSFAVGLCSVGGASIGLGWPLACLFSLVVALTMGQVASAYPTAGGLYHWANYLGGRWWGWVTAWFNLAGLITVMAAINVGTFEFALSSLGKKAGLEPEEWKDWKVVVQTFFVLGLVLVQATINHRGIRLTTMLTDFSGWWILIVAILLTLCLLFASEHWEVSRLVRFENFSGLPAGENPIWLDNDSLLTLFFLGLLLPAYTITGFDASAHASEETVNAAAEVPRGIVRSVIVSGIFGWFMLVAIVLAAPNLSEAAEQGGDAFVFIVDAVLPAWLAIALYVGIVIAQFLCGLATVTSASRMLFAFARDGGVPFSGVFCRVHVRHKTPIPAIWAVGLLSVAFTIYTPVYTTITAVCSLLLYISYVLPTALGLWAHGRTWTTMGPWTLGNWYRPLAAVAVLGCIGLFVIAIQPPNDKALWFVLGFVAVLGVLWFTLERKRFRGPPRVR